MSSDAIEARIEYRFRNRKLIEQALTHRSHGARHNERLEFLGDSVLNCAVAAIIFGQYPDLREGELSRVRASIVCQDSLRRVAEDIGISQFIRLGAGEIKSGGRLRASILADAVEGIIGAVYLDGGFESALAVIRRIFSPLLESIAPGGDAKDPKTQLQEMLQRKRIPLPIYEVTATSGPDHAREFEVECQIPKLGISVSGRGTTRRAAEQAAAENAFKKVSH